MCDQIDLHFGKRLRRRRRLLGLTQQEVGDACGLRFQQIQKYESGVNRMAASTLWRLSRALGVDASYFYEGLEEVAPPTPIATTRRRLAAA